MKPSRVSLLVGLCTFAAFVAYAYTAAPNKYPDGTSGVHLDEVIVAAVFLFGTAFCGCFLALRSARPERLSFSTALLIAAIYFAVTALLNLLPMKLTLRSDEIGKLAIGLVTILVFCTVMPYLISRYVRSRLEKGITR